MSSVIKKIINKSFAILGYEPLKSGKPATVIHNVFKAGHSKTALLSYIRSVFESEASKNDLGHTNRYTTFVMAQILHELGYKVDVVDVGDNYQGDFDKYSLVIGLGKTLDTAIAQRRDKQSTRVIWFGTGCNPLFSNVMTLQRLSDVYQRTGRLMLSSVRYIKEDFPLQHELADHIILHGAAFARATYAAKRISSIEAPVFMHHNVTRKAEEWAQAKTQYLWFGNGGLAHKGLDLAIEAFRQMPHLHLHICGSMEHETEFYNYYKPIIEASSNMSYHGFMNIKSDAFAAILKSCAFVVFPSAAEGNSPSVITCMANGGLIPVVTEQADVDLHGNGFFIDGLTVEAVREAVTLSQGLSLEDMKTQSAALMQITRRLNTFDYFKADFKQQLQQAIQNFS